jgi:hypothetical protein
MMERWDAYLEDPEGDELLRIARDNRIVFTIEEKEMYESPEHITPGFTLGWVEAYQDKDPDFPLPFDVLAYQDGLLPPSEDYVDGYVAQWFPIQDAPVTCGNRKDLPRKQRVHDYVSLGIDVKNKGTLGIVEVIVFACSICGKDWRE